MIRYSGGATSSLCNCSEEGLSIGSTLSFLPRCSGAAWAVEAEKTLFGLVEAAAAERLARAQPVRKGSVAT